MASRSGARALLFDLGERDPGDDVAAPVSGTSRNSGGGLFNVDDVEVSSVLSGPNEGEQSPMYHSSISFLCVFLANEESKGRYCLGRIGTSGEKACSKDLVGAEGTCGTASHVNKADVRSEFLYYWDPAKNFISLGTRLPYASPMAKVIYDMRDDGLTHVQVKELFDLVITGAVTSEESLLQARDRMISVGLGIGYTPRKKARFSMSPDGSTVEVDMLEVIDEAPDPLATNEVIGQHMIDNWPKVLQVIDVLRTSLGRSKRVEEEVTKLGDDIDELNAMGRRLMSLVGTPKDGDKFDLFKIVSGMETAVLELTAKMMRIDMMRREVEELKGEVRRPTPQEEIYVDGIKVDLKALGETMTKTVCGPVEVKVNERFHKSPFQILKTSNYFGKK